MTKTLKDCTLEEFAEAIKNTPVHQPETLFGAWLKSHRAGGKFACDTFEFSTDKDDGLKREIDYGNAIGNDSEPVSLEFGTISVVPITAETRKMVDALKQKLIKAYKEREKELLKIF
ncbi:MAG: hypothetical protein GY928_34140 [Colwellia sp.]|nr:hypothetical protein [Colwellia sp.]